MVTNGTVSRFCWREKCPTEMYVITQPVAYHKHNGFSSTTCWKSLEITGKSVTSSKCMPTCRQMAKCVLTFNIAFTVLQFVSAANPKHHVKMVPVYLHLVKKSCHLKEVSNRQEHITSCLLSTSMLICIFLFLSSHIVQHCNSSQLFIVPRGESCFQQGKNIDS